MTVVTLTLRPNEAATRGKAGSNRQRERSNEAGVMGRAWWVYEGGRKGASIGLHLTAKARACAAPRFTAASVRRWRLTGGRGTPKRPALRQQLDARLHAHVIVGLRS